MPTISVPYRIVNKNKKYSEIDSNNIDQQYERERTIKEVVEYPIANDNQTISYNNEEGDWYNEDYMKW